MLSTPLCLCRHFCSWKINSWRRSPEMQKPPTCWWEKWISSTNRLLPLSAWPRPQHWEVSPRSPYPPGEIICLLLTLKSSSRTAVIPCTYLTFISSLHRFLFVLLGPQGKAKSYNEIGRAIATLMVDDVSACKYFCDLPSSLDNAGWQYVSETVVKKKGPFPIKAVVRNSNVCVGCVVAHWPIDDRYSYCLMQYLCLLPTWPKKNAVVKTLIIINVPSVYIPSTVCSACWSSSQGDSVSLSLVYQFVQD